MIEASAMRNTYLAAGLTDAQLAAFGALGEVRTFSSGHVLARIGEPASEMYLVLSGEATVTTADNDQLGVIPAGQVVGEIALVDDRPRAANVVCCGSVTVGAFDLKTLRRHILSDKDAGLMIMANIARLLAARLRHADAVIDTISDRVGDSWDHAAG